MRSYSTRWMIPNARFQQQHVPPILCATLPHLTDRHEELFDELGPVAEGQPKQPPAAHFQYLFEWLCERFGRDVWVERSGGSLMFGARLLRQFPKARWCTCTATGGRRPSP